MQVSQQSGQKLSPQTSLIQLQQVVHGARYYLPAGLESELASQAVIDLSALSTDSRAIPDGSLFVALRGERFDAHDFLPQIATSGAVAVVAQQVPPDYPLPALLVPDTLKALAEIAAYWRQQFTLPVIAVTGSNGKTTVKEMIASICASMQAFHIVSQRLAT